MGVLGAYRRLLANRPLTRLLAGEFISSVGDWLYLVALLIIVYDRTRDPLVLGIVGAARVLPYVILSIPAGILADRYDRRKILLITDLCRGGCMVLLAILVMANAPIEALVAVTILATCFSSFFGPAIGSYLPSLVTDEADLGPANSAYATLDNIAFIGGPAIAAILLSVASVELAFLLNAVSFVVVAGILWTLPASRAGAANKVLADAMETSGGTEHAGEVIEPAGPRRNIRVPIAAIALMHSAQNFAFGGLGVLIVVIAFDRLGVGEEGTGLLNAAIGIGGFVGALVSGVLVLQRRLAWPLAAGAVLISVSVAALGFSNSLPVAMLAVAGAALGSLLGGVVSETLFQRIVPDEIRGRTLGIIETLAVLAYAAGSFLLPALAPSLGLDRVLILAGGITIVAAIIAIPLLGPAATQAPKVDPVRRTLSEFAAFRILPPGRLETAERRATVVPMHAGQAIIRQGDLADRFYVIASGEVEVTQAMGSPGAAVVLRRMGPREGFGEIGLLSGVPRTATVTAITDGQLVALDKDEFLSLVGSSKGLTFPFMDAHRGGAASA